MESEPFRTHNSNREEDGNEASSDTVRAEVVEKIDHSAEVENKLLCKICSEAFETQEALDIHSITHRTAEPEAPLSQAELFKQLQTTVAASQAMLQIIDHEQRKQRRELRQWKAETQRLDEEARRNDQQL